MLQIFQPLINQQYLVKVIDERGFAVENIPGIGWINNIGNWAHTEGYYVRVSSNCTLSVTGLPIQLPLDIPLINGWNIISYPVSEPRSAMLVFNELITSNKLVKVVSQSGAALEFIPGIGWINNIGDLQPGQGYYVKVNSDCTLIIHPTVNSRSNKSLEQKSSNKE